jgi:DNA-binding Lrp family transcriptional regulator
VDESLKRRAPKAVDSIVIKGIKFVVNHKAEKNLSAIDKSGKLLWEKTVPLKEVDLGEEADVRKVFIKELREEKGLLVVIDEANNKYLVDPLNGKVL